MYNRSVAQRSFGTQKEGVVLPAQSCLYDLLSPETLTVCKCAKRLAASAFLNEFQDSFAHLRAFAEDRRDELHV